MVNAEPAWMLWNIYLGVPGLDRLDARELDHPGPLFGVVRNQLAKFAGEAGRTVPPTSTSRALVLESAKAALISLLSVSMIPTGVSLGATRPYHALTS